MAISRFLMNRQLRADGGIMQVAPREKFGIGSSIKKFVRKIIPNEVAEIAVKAAPFVAPFNPAVAAAMSGLGSFDQTGRIGDSLKSGALTYGLGQGARFLGGAELQGNPFQQGGAFRGGFEGFKGGFSSPLGTQSGFKLGKPTQRIDTSMPLKKPNLISEQLSEVSLSPSGTVADTVKTVTDPGSAMESIKSIVSFDTSATQKTDAALDLLKRGSKALFYTNGKLDKNAVLGAITGVASYMEAKALADEAGVELSQKEYDDAKRDEKREEYASYLQNFFGGKKDGGRIGFESGANKMIEEKIAELKFLTDKLMTEEGIQDRGYASKLASDIIRMKNEDIDPDRLKFLNNESSLFALPRDIRPEDEYYDTLKALENRANGGRIGFESGANEMIKTQLLEEIMPDTSTEDFVIIMTEDGPVRVKKSEYDSMPGMFRDTTTGEGSNMFRIKEANGGRIGFRSGTIILAEDELAEMGGEQGLKLKLLAEKFMEDGMSESDAYEKAADSLYAKGGRVSRKFGSPEKGESEIGIMSIDVEAGDDEDEEDMMMAGITFSRPEKSYLFRRLGGSGGADRSYTMPNLYRILNNPNKYPEDAAILKEIAIMGLGEGQKDGGRIGYKDGANRVSELLITRAGILAKDPDADVSDIDGEIFQLTGKTFKSVGGISDIPTGKIRKNSAGVVERDYRDEGGFVPVGVKERADDVPAMLSKNEFVMTADAVRGIGNGSVEEGSKKLYNTMKKAEQVGKA